MELSETWLKKFEQEGFASVFDWSDPAGTVYDEHVHTGRVSLFVTDGAIVFDFEGERKEVTAGERFDVLPGALYSAIVGPQGWSGVVGEEIEGDS